MLATRHRSCASTTKTRGVPWVKTCRVARNEYRLHSWLLDLSTARYDSLYGFPHTNDWMTAVAMVQRWFPGSAAWLDHCSSSEGGHGAWVPNRQGSGAGGWMQYMSGTFEGDYAQAVAYLAARGVSVPAALHSWYSAEGQAIAAGWAYGHSRGRGKWTGVRC